MTDEKYPEGVGYIEEMGWSRHAETGEERFAAIVVFPNGPPDLTAGTIWRHDGVTIVRVEPDARAGNRGG